MSKKQTTPPKDYPQSIEEAYKMVKKVMLSDDKELIEKMRAFLNNAEDDWVWVKMKLLTDCYESADAVGREEFSLISLNKHVKNGTALPLAELFVDPETEIEYLEYLMADGTIYRVPIATPEMDKYTYQKAGEKKFLGDFIERHSVDDTEYIPLDTMEKVDAYNDGTFFEKFVYGKNRNIK